MCSPGDALRVTGRDAFAPQVGRLKSNVGLRSLRPSWCIGLASAGAMLVLVVVAVVYAVRGGASAAPNRRAEVIVGHPPEHTRTQAPTPHPHPLNIGNLIPAKSNHIGHPAEHPRTEAEEAGLINARATQQVGHGSVQTHTEPPPAKYVVGHPPEHTQTLKPRSAGVQDLD